MKTWCWLLVLSTFLVNEAYGQPQALGAVYGTRDPAVCKSKKEPATGAPSVQQAILYFRCEKEKVGGGSDTNLYLFENVQLEVGKGRPFQVSQAVTAACRRTRL